MPGIYSLSPYTLEEVISRDYLLQNDIDVILNIVDASNIERNLYLTTQLLEMGIPVTIALNMMDVIKSNGDTIKTDYLAKALDCNVVGISALRGDGVKDAADIAVRSTTAEAPKYLMFSEDVEAALQK